MAVRQRATLRREAGKLGSRLGLHLTPIRPPEVKSARESMAALRGGATWE